MQWMIPYPSLDEDQRVVLDKMLGSRAYGIFLDGFAGSGKTVLFVHFIKRALKQQKKIFQQDIPLHI